MDKRMTINFTNWTLNTAYQWLLSLSAVYKGGTMRSQIYSLIRSLGLALRFVIVPAAPLILIVVTAPGSCPGRMAAAKLVLMGMGTIIGVLLHGVDVEPVESRGSNQDGVDFIGVLADIAPHPA
jgi:hypothetical protein